MGGAAEGVGEDEVELADIGGNEGRAHDIGAVDGARLRQELLELVHIAHRLLAEAWIALELLFDDNTRLPILELQDIAREDAALAGMEALPDRVGHRLIEDAGEID